MQDLMELQAWMQDLLQQPRLNGDNTKSNSNDDYDYLKPTGALSARESLAIYQKSYFSRLLTCLQQQFPALNYCLGEDTFNAFAREYLQLYPSQSYTLHDLGKHFVSYLMETRPDKDQPQEEKEVWIDFMVELANFERLAFTMFDAEGDEGNLLAAEAAIPDEELALQRCLNLYSSQFPVAQYYCQVRDNLKPKLPPRYMNFSILVRVAFRTRIIKVSELEFRVLQNFQKTQDIQRAIATTKTNTEDSGSTGSLMQQWLKPGGWREQWYANGFFVHKNSTNLNQNQ